MGGGGVVNKGRDTWVGAIKAGCYNSFSVPRLPCDKLLGQGCLWVGHGSRMGSWEMGQMHSSLAFKGLQNETAHLSLQTIPSIPFGAEFHCDP